MAGERDLKTLLATLSTVLEDDVYVFVTVDECPAGLDARMTFNEAEGLTLIVTREQAHAFDLAYEFPSRMITLNVHSSLEAVGFMAHIATCLAKEGMGVNPVAAFFHDHIFVPEDRAQDALRVLAQIALDAQSD